MRNRLRFDKLDGLREEKSFRKIWIDIAGFFHLKLILIGVDIFILYFVGRVKVVLVIGIVAVDLFMIGAVVLVAELLIGSVVGGALTGHSYLLVICIFIILIIVRFLNSYPIFTTITF